MVAFELPSAPPVTHKKSAITKTEFRSGMLTESERIRITKAMRCVNGGLSMAWLPFDLEQSAAAIGKPDETFYDLIAECFAAYKEAPELSVLNPDFIKGVALQAYVGLLDAPEREAEILLGFPISE